MGKSTRAKRSVEQALSMFAEIKETAERTKRKKATDEGRLAMIIARLKEFGADDISSAEKILKEKKDIAEENSSLIFEALETIRC